MTDAIKDYLNSIAKYPLLTPQQEIQLGRRVQRLRELQLLDRDLTNAEQREIRGGERARQRFIQSNLQLVVHVARRYQRCVKRTMEFSDIIQEGNIGLSRAVDLFDYSKGYKFSTYAYWWIRQAIMRSISQYDDMIRLPVNAHQKLRNASYAAEQMAKTTGKTPTMHEVAEEINMSADQLAMLYHQSYRIISLDALVNDDNNNSIVNTIADPNPYDSELELFYDHVESYMKEYLDEQTQSLIMDRLRDDPVPWHELSRRHNAHRETLRQKYRRGLSRLRMLLCNPLRDTPLGQL